MFSRGVPPTSTDDLFLFLSLSLTDRYVLLGNHIDSWVNGAVDATSGTTVMMEIARVLGQKYKTGWFIHHF